MIALLVVLVAAAIIYLALSRRAPWQERRNRPYGGYNLSRYNRKIGREIEWSWKQTVQGLYLSNQTNLTEEEKFSLKNASIEVYWIGYAMDGFVIAVAWVDNKGRPIPAIVRAALLGVPEPQLDKVQRGRQVVGENPLPPDAFHIACMHDGRRWTFVAWEEDDGSVKGADLPDEVHAIIGEPVLIHNSYKQPPFAVTVLGPAEAVNQQIVQVPVQVTGLIPRWSYDHAGEIWAYLETALDGSGNFRAWCTNGVEPGVRHANGPGLIPGSLTLVKRGSYQGYLRFGPEAAGTDSHAPDEPFVRLKFIDGSEQIIDVDLTQSIEPARRVRFEEGRPDDTWLPAAVMARLENYDDSWSYLPDPAPAVLGDTVSVPRNFGELPFFDLTVLGQPERVNDNLVRMPVRVVARWDQDSRFLLVEAQLSTTPDGFGQIHDLYDIDNDFSHDRLPSDAIDLTNMARGEIREGYLYFVPDSGQPETVAPEKPFTILWYGPTMYELPMDLTVTRR